MWLTKRDFNFTPQQSGSTSGPGELTWSFTRKKIASLEFLRSEATRRRRDWTTPHPCEVQCLHRSLLTRKPVSSIYVAYQH
ncbi:hypothetical protein RRG08_066943 [Elysia crispata]|uniref:Uncharacterized protein n=1 Tax=Elysia crispata TaxID=231223 RepID=A0AAE1AR80_9GAST|nr:hypothetical protein RRG08_066943 [Elysia crispata]